jgi:hypothetical protein
MPTSSRYLAALSLVAGGVDALFPDCTNLRQVSQYVVTEAISRDNAKFY